MSYTITPRVGYYYQSGDSISFRIRQKYTDASFNKLVFYCLDSAILNNNWINESTSSQAIWSIEGTEYTYDARKIFPNRPMDTFFDLPFIESNGVISFDLTEVAQYNDGASTPSVIDTIPAIRSIGEVSITYPSNAQAFTNPPVISAFNPTGSVDVQVYYGNNLPLADFGKVMYASASQYRLNTSLYLYTNVQRSTSNVPLRKKMTVSKYRAGSTWSVNFVVDDDIYSFGCVQTGDTFSQ